MARPRKPKGYLTALFEAIGKAQELLDECEVRDIPVNLLPLARHQGIQQVKEMDISLDGQLLELESGGYEVIVSKNASLARRRFTLAHEIAHTLLSTGEGSAACGVGLVEELCNAAAAEILVPSRFLRKLFSTAEITVRSFVEVSKSFRCSLEVAGWRLLNMGFIEGALLIWRMRLEAGGEVLELAAVPHTWGWQVPVKTGMVLRPGEPLWKMLHHDQSAPAEIRDLWPGHVFHGEPLRMRKTALLFLYAAPKKELNPLGMRG